VGLQRSSSVKKGFFLCRATRTRSLSRPRKIRRTWADYIFQEREVLVGLQKSSEAIQGFFNVKSSSNRPFRLK
jgi:hypothetical protein